MTPWLDDGDVQLYPSDDADILQIAETVCTPPELAIIHHCHTHPTLTWADRAIDLDTPITTLKSRYLNAHRKIVNHKEHR